MAEYIVSWSAYGPSGRIQADSQEMATRFVEGRLWDCGLETKVVVFERTDPSAKWDGHFVILRSAVKRYGDMASFGVCVYPVGHTSFYDRQRDQLEAQKAVRETQEITHATG